MKKNLTAVLAFLLLATLLLSACGSSAGTSSAEPAAAAVTETVGIAEETDEAAEVEEVPEPEPAAEPEAVEEPVTETVIAEALEYPEYAYAMEDLKSLFPGHLENFPLGEDYVLTVPSAWWIEDNIVYAEFDLQQAYALLTTSTIAGFSGYTTGDIIDNDENRNMLLDGIVSELAEPEVLETGEATINGIRVLTQKTSYLIEGDRYTAKFVLFIDEAGNLESITFIQSELAKSDYTERFDAILNTLRPKDVDPDLEGIFPDIDKAPIIYTGKYPDAESGSLKRRATLADNELDLKYVVPYYKAYFQSDDEIHYLTNYMVTYSIQMTGPQTLLVVKYNYVNGEEESEKIEHGEALNIYSVDLETGRITDYS